MTISRVLAPPLAALLLCVCVARVEAQGIARTWVSGLGVDSVGAPCTRTSPCRTFNGAAQATAPNGVIGVLNPNGYGTITITKSIAIDGDGMLASILASGQHGIVINITDPADSGKVRIRGLSINGASRSAGMTGIAILAANEVTISGTTIDGFSSGVVVTGVNANVVIERTTIKNNSGAGIAAAGGTVTLSNVAIVFNGSGLEAPGGIINSFGNNVIWGNLNAGASPNVLPLK